MKQSKPGKALDPMIKQWTEKIYKRDKTRYHLLCKWVWTQQDAGWPDEAIAEALRLADPHIDLAAHWWGYLCSLLSKAKGRASEQEAKNYKTEVGQIAEDFLEFVKAKRNVRSVQG